MLSYPIKLLFHNAREVSQVTRVYPDPLIKNYQGQKSKVEKETITHKRPVAQVVERHCNGTEVQDTAPGEKMIFIEVFT